MDPLRSFADNRLVQGCAYCGSANADTRDHVPSRALLDSPFPANLPVMGACRSCNGGFSADEEYVACLMECVLHGPTEPEKLTRTTIAATLERNRPAHVPVGTASDDRGVQNLSMRYSERLADAGIAPSVGSRGDLYDNALAESVIGLCKAEVIHRDEPWRSFDDVEYVTLEWGAWFNTQRLLEPLGYLPPAEYEAQYHRARPAHAAVGVLN